MRLFGIFSSVMLIGASSFFLRKSFSYNQHSITTAMSATARVVIDKAIANNKVMVFSKTYCPYCAKTKSTLKELGIEHSVLELDTTADGGAIQDELTAMTNQRTVPNVFVNGKHLGGNDATQAAIKDGSFMRMLQGK